MSKRFQDIPRRYTVKDILDMQPKFKEWILQTKLFNVLKEITSGKTVWDSFQGVPPSIVSDEISMNLTAGVVISTPYDLPYEVLVQFYMNSPFFDGHVTEDIYSQIKLIDNG